MRRSKKKILSVGLGARLRKATPAVMSSTAGFDPSGIATFALAGAQFGYSLNWLMIAVTPMLVAVESMCGRLAGVKRKKLSAIFGDHFPKPIVLLASFVLVLVNIATISADLSGMSSAVVLVVGRESLAYLLAIALLLWGILFFIDYKRLQNYLAWVVLFSLCYGIAAILAKPSWALLLKQLLMPSIVPSFGLFATILALLGTTIGTYLFSWQESAKSKQKKVFLRKNIVALFIMTATAAMLFSQGVTDIRDVGVAAAALTPFAGYFGKFIFALGFLGAGFLALPVLTTATGYAVADTFGWKKSKGLSVVMLSAMIIGAGILIVGIDPIKALFYSQVLAGIFAPILLILLLLLCNSHKIMGTYVNKIFDNIFGFLALLSMSGATVGFFWQFFR